MNRPRRQRLVITRVEGSTLEIRRRAGANGWFNWFSSSPWVMVTLPEFQSVRASGGSDIMVSVEGRLVGSASGGSDVLYRGNPDFVDVNVSGGADLTQQ